MAYSDDISPREIATSYMTADEIGETRKPVEKASILPLSIYANRAFYEREVELVLRPGWHAVAHVDQLQETGAFVTAEIVGEPVVVVRDKDGGIRALSNVCQHRGSRLVSDCGVAKLLMCPFHTWTYNLDGSLRGAPHMNKVDDFDRKSVALPNFLVEIWNGFVFVNLDPQAAALSPTIAPLTDTLAAFNFDQWELVPYKSFDVDWNWKISMENFTEAYHHVGVHSETIGKISKAENARYEDTNTNYSLFYVHIDPTGEQHEGEEFLPDQGDRPFPAYPGLPDLYHAYSPVANIYPSFHLVIGPNFALWLRFEIEGPQKHRMIWSWLLPPGSKALPDFAERMDEVAAIMAPVMAEDMAFMPNMQKSLGSRTFQPGRYSDQERAVHQMHQWLLNRLEEKGGLFEPKA